MQTDEHAMDHLELVVLVYSEFVIVPIDAVLPLRLRGLSVPHQFYPSRLALPRRIKLALPSSISLSSRSHTLTHVLVCFRESYTPSHTF